MKKNDDKSTLFSEKRIFTYNGKTMDFSVPRVMGIVNLTPDSFYDKGTGRLGDMGTGSMVVREVEEMVKEGAYVVDVGAVSTRPGAEEVSAEEELGRLLGPLKEIRRHFPELIISIDTYRSEVAEIAAGEGADMINDISGGTFDPLMIPLVTRLGIPYIIMHIQGTPRNMQADPQYKDVGSEVFGFLESQAQKLSEAGHRRIILDPGFGFGKTVEHNYLLLQRLGQLAAKGYPVLAGVSRKSMINRVLGTRPETALNGTTVLNTIALLNGATILRVHDVKEAVDAVKLTRMVIGSNGS